MLSLKHRPPLLSSSPALGPLRTSYTYIQTSIIRPRKNNRYDMIYFIFIANQVKSWMHVPSSYYSWRNGGGRPIGFLFYFIFWLGVWGSADGLRVVIDIIIDAVWRHSFFYFSHLKTVTITWTVSKIYR